MGGNHAIWYQQVPVFAAERRVVTWDQRGFGRSTNRAGEPTPSSAVADLRALLDALGVERAHVIGQSMGGWAAVGMALAHPERVRSLTVADSIGGIYTAAIEEQFDQYVAASAGRTPPDRLPLGEHPALGSSLARRDPARAFLYQQLQSLGDPPPAEAPVALRRTRYDPADLGRLRVPALFVVGEGDPIFPPKTIHRAAALVPGARVVEIPDAGHSPYFEQPERWNIEVLSFIASVRD
jgi:pimeloyl-ACP methyl ester carboxylesterase